jgi:hypothetical protein
LKVSAAGVAIDLTLGPTLAWLHFSGDLYDQNSDRDGATWGGFFNARVSSGAGRWGLFGLFDAQLYPAQSSVYAKRVDREWTLPALSLALVVGARLSP